VDHRDLPVLRTLAEMFETGKPPATRGPACRPDGPDRAVRGGRTEGPGRPGHGGPEGIISIDAHEAYPIAITGVTERALRAVGQWPASGLRKTAAFLGGAGKEVLYRVITGAPSGEITQHVPPHL
jgi:hypothetical protein